MPTSANCPKNPSHIRADVGIRAPILPLSQQPLVRRFSDATTIYNYWRSARWAEKCNVSTGAFHTAGCFPPGLYHGLARNSAALIA